MRSPAIAYGPNSLSAAGVVATKDISDDDMVTVQVIAPGTGCTITYEASIDGTTWTPVVGCPIGGGTLVSTTTTAGIWQFAITGALKFRIRVSTYGSATVTTTSTAIGRAT